MAHMTYGTYEHARDAGDAQETQEPAWRSATRK